MNITLFALGIYVLMGALFIGLRWAKISEIGRAIIGDKVRIAIPILVLFWPPFAYTFIKDEILVWSCVRRARRNSPLCPCGLKLKITAGHIRSVRDDEAAEAVCSCGQKTILAPQKPASKNP